jgi:hypothetical protein
VGGGVIAGVGGTTAWTTGGGGTGGGGGGGTNGCSLWLAAGVDVPFSAGGEAQLLPGAPAGMN